MSYLASKDVAAGPEYDVVTGLFCYPPPVSYVGRIQSDNLGPKPLAVGTDATITQVGGNFRIETIFDVSDWGVNEGDYVKFSGTGVDGYYLVLSVNLPEIIVAGPGQSVSTGFLIFDNKPQKIVGTNSKFKKLSEGDYMVVAGLNPTVQARKIVKIIDDETLYVEDGFIGNVSDKPVMISKKGLTNGVSINCVGSGVVLEKNVAANDILTFFDDTGLRPIYGDSGSNVFKILIQKK